MAKKKESELWSIIGKVALVIGIIAGILAIVQSSHKKDAPENHTSGNNSPIIETRDGDVDIRYGKNSDSLKSGSMEITPK